MSLPDQHPVLETRRLQLRPFTPGDAERVKYLAGTEEVYRSTMSIPHPYKLEHAAEWIAQHPEFYAENNLVIWAITLPEAEQVIGCISLKVREEMDMGEFGYWLGRDYWNRGFCSEALAGVLAFGFETLGLNRMYAPHMNSNPASGKVMLKNGLKYEGCLRSHLKKDDRYEDIIYYGILKSEYQ